MTTPAEFKALWLEALRSGEHKQTTGCLHDTKGFCCLGVAIDVAIKHKLVPYDWQEYAVDRPEGLETTMYAVYPYEGDEADVAVTGMLPPQLQGLLGCTGDPVVPFEDRSCFAEGNVARLSDLNDSEGLSFAEIADLIERYL